MATVVCCKCSRVIEVTGGVPPKSCPACGGTLDNAADFTDTFDPAGQLPKTIVAPVDSPMGGFGRYQVERKLGSGGFGAVFLARDPKLDRLVAIKIPDPSVKQTAATLERFAREGRNAAQLRHPGIVSIYNVEEDQGLVFIVSEYVEGEPLAFQFKKGKMSFRAAASLLAAVASAVEYAHSKGIIHRDIKPGNIMIDPAGNPRLMDFGLAKREQRDPTVTIHEQILGTPAYMSPEQARGRPEGIDRRTDIYSLGATFYHLLTNELPFHGESREVRDKVLAEEPKRPRLIDKQIPVDLETICLKAMEKDPAKRYQTARDLADDLERWLRGEPIVARHIGPFERSWRWCRRNPAPAGMIASVALLLIVITVGSGVMAAVSAEGRKKEAEGRRQEAAAKEVQANARLAAETSRNQLAEALAKNQELLSRAYAERAARYVRAPAASPEHAPMRSFPWLLEAMRLDAKNPSRLAADRIGLQTLLDASPFVERMWFCENPTTLSGISPQRDKFVIAERDGTLNLWKVANQGPPLTLRHPTAVDVVAYSPDGARLASGSSDGLRIWDTENGKLLKGPLCPKGVQAEPNRRAAWNLRFSSTGRLISSCVRTGRRTEFHILWNSEKGEPLGPPRKLFSVDVGEFADHDKLLVQNVNGLPHVFDVEAGKDKYPLDREKNDSYVFKLGPDGVTLATIDSKSGRIDFLNVATGKKLGKPLVAEAGSGARSVAFSPDGKLFATGCNDGVLRLWNIADGRLLWKKQVLASSPPLIQFSPDGLNLLSGSLGKLSVLAVQDGKEIAGPLSMNRPRMAEWANTPGRLLTVDSDGVARLWNLRSRLQAGMLPLLNAHRSAVSADRSVLAAAEGADNFCQLFSLAGERFDPSTARRFAIATDGTAIKSLALTADGSRIAVAGEHDVFVFETADHKRLCGPLAHDDNVERMRFTHDGKRLVCATWKGQASVWDVASGKRLYAPVPFGMVPCDIDIDTAGKRCAVASMRGVVVFYLESGKPLREGFIGGGAPLFTRFLADPNHLLIGAYRSRVWDLTTWQPVAAVDQQGFVHATAVAADKSRFLTGGLDGVARLWFADTALPASPPLEHPSPLAAATLDPTNRYLLTVTEDNSVFLWEANSAELLAAFSLAHLESQFGLPEGPRPDAWKFPPLVFFSKDSRTAYVLSTKGLLVTLNIDVDARSVNELALDVAVRNGTEFDGAGGLRTLQPPELAARWANINRGSFPQGPRLSSATIPHAGNKSD